MRKKKVIAPIWKRSFAYLIDLFIVNVIIFYPFNSFFKKIPKEININLLTPDIIFISIFTAILSIFYWTIMEYTTSQSVGKLLMKIYVTSEKKLLFWQCLVRNLTKFSIILIMIDSIPIIIKKETQRYLERISNTFVIEKNE